MENRRRREFLKASGIVLGGLIITSPLAALARKTPGTNTTTEAGRGFWTGYYQGGYSYESNGI